MNELMVLSSGSPPFADVMILVTVVGILETFAAVAPAITRLTFLLAIFDPVKNLIRTGLPFPGLNPFLFVACNLFPIRPVPLDLLPYLAFGDRRDLLLLMAPVVNAQLNYNNLSLK